MQSANAQSARLLEFDRDTFGLIQRLHRAVCRKSPLSTFAAIRDQLVRHRQHIDTRYILLTAVTRTIFDESTTNDAAWRRFFRAANDIELQHVGRSPKVVTGKKRGRATSTNETRRLRNLAVVASLWSPEVTARYKLNLAAQRQMYMIRACATTYPDFESFRYRWNALRLARHCRALKDGKEKTIQEATIQLKDFNLADLASVEIDETYEALWTKNNDGAIPIDDRGTCLSSIRPKHFHLYLLEKDERGVLMPRSTLEAERISSTNHAVPGTPNEEMPTSCSGSSAPVLTPASEPGSPVNRTEASSPITLPTSNHCPHSLKQLDSATCCSRRNTECAESPPLLPPPSPQFYLPVSEASLHRTVYLGGDHHQPQIAGTNNENALHPAILPLDDPVLEESVPLVGSGSLWEATEPSSSATLTESSVNAVIKLGRGLRRLETDHECNQHLFSRQFTPTTRIYPDSAIGSLNEWSNTWSVAADNLRQCQEACDNEADVPCYSSVDFENIASSGQILLEPVLIKENFIDGHKCSIEDVLSSLQDALGAGLIKNVSSSAKNAGSFSAEELSTLWKENRRSGLAIIDLPDVLGAHRPMFTMLKRFRLLDMLMLRVKHSLIPTSAPCSFVRLTSNELAIEGAVVEARSNPCSGSWFRCLEGTSLWKLSFKDAEQIDGPRGVGVEGKCRSKFVVLERDDVLLIPPGCNVIYSYHAPSTCVLSKGLFWDEYSLLPMLRSTTNNSWQLDDPDQRHHKCTCNTVLEALQDLVCKQPARFSVPLPPATWEPDFQKSLADLKTSMRTCLGDRRYLSEASNR